MKRIPAKSPSEHDVLTGWRRRYCWTQRAGACAKVKRRYRRRERRQGKAEIRREES